MQKIPGPTFLKLRLNMMNSSDQSRTHIFKKKYSLHSVSQNRFMMNDTISIKNAVDIVFTSDFCILNFLAFGFFGLNQAAL
jgi:hypothetical protein